LNGFEKANSNSWTRYYSQGLLGQEASIPAQFRPELEQAGERVIQLYQAWGKPDRVAKWGKKLQKTRSSPPPQSP
jgi:hypothetical protein